MSRPWWVQFSHWLWKAACFLGTVVVLPVVINVLSTWFTNANGIIPATSFLGQLVVHWPLTVLVSGTLLLFAVVTWILSREPVHAPVTVSLAQQNRARMLKRLRSTYQQLHHDTLQQAVRLELGLAQMPHAVQNAATLLLERSDHGEELLSAGTSILTVFHQCGQELLILGKPGAGKSTLLYEIELELVERAEQCDADPLPIYLPLSSWAQKRLTLQEWIAQQSAQLYDIPQDVVHSWIEDKQLLPLLDGLDEMDEGAGSACISAINRYHHHYLTPLVVCSRSQEYEDASRQQRLSLQNAVVVQPLTIKEVDTHLAEGGKSLEGLRRALKVNVDLQELASSPLMLNVLMLTYQGTSVRQLSKKSTHLQQQVWKDYIERMIDRKGNKKRYPLGPTRSWLGWLACQMQAHGETVFYLEHLQPDWLEARQQRVYTWWMIRLPGPLIGILLSLLIWLFIDPTSDLVSSLVPVLVSVLGFILPIGVLGGLLGGLWSGPVWEGGLLVPEKKQWHVWRKQIMLSVFIALLVGIIFASVPLIEQDLFHVVFNFYDSELLYNWQFNTPRGGLIFGFMFGWSSLFLQQLLAGTSAANDNVSIAGRHPRRLFQTIHGRRALLVAVVICLGYGLSTVLYNWSIDYQELIQGLSGGLIYGLSTGLIYLFLAVQSGDIRLTERLRWTWGSLGRSLLTSNHLRITLLLAFSTFISLGLNDAMNLMIVYDWIDGLFYGLTSALSIGLNYWFLLGLFQGIAQERIEDEDRRVPNQGIRDSLRNSVCCLSKYLELTQPC